MQAAELRDQDPQVLGDERTPSEGVFLESEGALVTSRWVAIGDHTFATQDVTSVFIRQNKQRVTGVSLAAVGLLLALFDVPLALTVTVLAVLVAVVGAMHPVLELVIVAAGRKSVAAQAAAKPPASDGPARLQEIHMTLKRAMAGNSEKLRPDVAPLQPRRT